MTLDETSKDAVSLSDELLALTTDQTSQGREIRCIECGYGVVSAGPLQCPACGGDAWDFTEWSPFQRRGGT